MSSGVLTMRRAPALASRIRQFPDRAALTFLTVLATGLVAVPAAMGSLVLPGDDLFQNEPLRVLTGTILRSGRLPAWDPLIWSGTPLLAGWNAGAMFPGTWLFAIVPSGLAWTVNLALTYVVCSTGAHILLRRIGLRPLSAFLGALIFTYAGFMNGQIVHLGLVQGTAFLPWLLLGIEWAIDARSSADRIGAVVLVACASALTVLAGDPRAPTSTAIVVAVWLAGRFLCGVPKARATMCTLLAGSALGVALCAIQWIPGIGFLHSSQRAVAPFSFFTTGSLDLQSLASNVLVPFLIGGNGNLGLPVYSGAYNQPEVTVGAGFVSLVAFGAYLPALLRSVWSRWRRRRASTDRAPGYRLGSAYALVVIGVILTLGGKTPIGHLLVHLPLYGGERLQNRNAVIFDLGLTMLVAFLVDDLTGRRRLRADRNEADVASTDRPPVTTGTRVLATWPSVLLGIVGPLGAVALVVIALAKPLSLGRHMHVLGDSATLFAGLRPYLVTMLVVAAVLGIFVGLARYLPDRVRRLGVVAFVLADVAVYLTGIGLGTVPASAVASRTPESTALINMAGQGGRLAIYNPGFQSIGDDPRAPERYGVTDVNLVREMASVQGYGSIVNSGYENVTNTHAFEDLSTSALNTTTFDRLNLTALFTLPSYLSEPIAHDAAVPFALGGGTFSSGPNVASRPPFASGPYPISTSQPATFFLASPRHLHHVAIFLSDPHTGPSRLQVTAFGPGGAQVTRSGPVIGGTATVELPTALPMTEIRIVESAGPPATISAVIAVTRAPDERLLLDGALQDQLVPPHWTYGGTVGPLIVFLNHRAKGDAWLESRTGVTSSALGSVHTRSRLVTDPVVMTVDARHPAVLVRSEEYAPGWTARLRPVGGGPTIVLAVHQDGLIQQVSIPAGRYTVTWRYAPTGVLIGLVLTLGGFAVLLALMGVSLRRRTGRRGIAT
jgi:hypothetical protein